jgi:peroxiredoxin
MPQPVRVPADLTLAAPDGAPARFADLLARNRLTVVQLVRYFGCLPCQEWLLDLDRAADRLSGLGAGVAAVGGSADYQARWLREEKGVTMPLLLDPAHELRQVVGAVKPLGLRMLNPRGAAAYARSMGRGFRPQAITRDTVRTPGVVVVDRDGEVRWRHIGTRIGDYPPLDQVLEAVVRA